MTVAAALGGLVAIQLSDYSQPAEPIAQANDVMTIPSNFTSNVAGVSSALPSLSDAAERAVNSVVHVKTTQEGQEYYQVDPFRYFFYGQPGQKKKGPDRQGSGSGVVISTDGYIVTNNHVIDGADEIEIVLNDNRTYNAQVVGADPSTDIALLKVDAADLEIIPLGDSDDAKLGEWVLAVGNPYNLTSTVTAGIVSAKARNINLLRSNNPNLATLESFIQTDAAVNPGNSGGALVNSRGELIGINTAIQSPTGSYSGYAFAVPSNLVRKVVDDLIEFGVVQRGFIGVSIKDLGNVDEELAVNEGAYIAGLADRGAAEEAGIEEGDVIVAVGTVRVKNVAELQEQVGRYRPGDKVAVTLNRDGEEIRTVVELRNKNGDAELINPEEIKVTAALGAQFKEVPEELKEQLKLGGGIQIEGLNGGKLRSAGIKQGFVITKIDKKPIRSFDDFEQAIDQAEGGVLIEGVYPNGIKAYYGVGL